MGQRFLIDTCAAIKYLTLSYPAQGIHFLDGIIDTESIISFISEIELQAWNPSNPDDINVYRDFKKVTELKFINPFNLH